MNSTSDAFVVHALPPAVLTDVRATRLDASGNAVVHLGAAGGEPLRCCLRDAHTGEALMLFGYEPELPASPYREVGPVFAHAEPCGARVETDGYPPAWRRRPQVVRGYDHRGWIRAAEVHDGSRPESVIAELLVDPEVVQVHSRNVAYGCYMFAVTRRP